MSKRRNGTPTLRELADRIARVERSGLSTAGGSSIDPAFAAATNASLASLGTRVTGLENTPHLVVREFIIGDGAASLFAIAHGLNNMFPDVIMWDTTTSPNVRVKGFDYLPIDLNNGAVVFQGYVPTLNQFRVAVSG